LAATRKEYSKSVSVVVVASSSFPAAVEVGVGTVAVD